MATHCARDAETRFESDIFNSLSEFTKCFSSEEDSSVMTRADGAVSIHLDMLVVAQSGRALKNKSCPGF